jgi:urease accessory protein
MFDAASRYETQPLQRARGSIVATFRVRDGVTALDTLHQSGCLKARFPRGVVQGWAELVTLNSSGGIAAGDRLSTRFAAAAAGARVTITAQAAERFYRARAGDPPAEIENRIDAAAGAAVEWLPQETIVYDGAALSRRLEVDVAAGASFLGIEMLVFGRALMGESVRRLRLRDRLAVNRGGLPLLYDAVRIDGDAASLLARAGIAGGMGAVATLVYVAADAKARLTGVREAFRETHAEAGASAEDGLLVARLLAPSGAALRRAVETALFVLRGRPLPRVWLC